MLEPVTVRNATRSDLEAWGYEEPEISKILGKQDGEPGQVLGTFEPNELPKPKWREFSIK